jgi:hypothetical protein
MLTQLTVINNKTISFFEKLPVKYCFTVLAAIHIIFISKIDTSILAIYNSLWTRVILALIIAWTACFDPVYSIVIAGVMILSIMELHRRYNSSAMQQKQGSNRQRSIVIPPNVVGSKTMPRIPKDIAMTDKFIYDEINKHSLQKTPASDDGILAEYDYYYDPAYTNLTDNLREQNTLRNGSFYVTSDELTAAQSNSGPGVNTGAITALNGSLNAQGMNTVIPSGYDKDMYSLDSKDLMQ